MKKLFIISLLCSGVLGLRAQEGLSASIYSGWLFPYMDLTEADYLGVKPNLALGAGMGYELWKPLRLRGDLVYGNMNGNNQRNYFETHIMETSLGFDLNLIGLFAPDFDAVKLNLYGGGGMNFYTARLYDINTGQKVTESPPRRDKALSPNAFAAYGASLGIRLSPKLDLTLGMTNRYVLDADWMDGFASGDATDHYGMATAGFVYTLRSDRKPGTIEVEENRFRKLNAQADSTKELRQEVVAQRERAEKLEALQSEHQAARRKIMRQLDSTRSVLAQNLDTIRTSSGDPTRAPDKGMAEKILSKVQYRLVVASLPSRSMAQRWIDRSRLDKSEMVIAYIENLDTYRVVYKSFDTYAAARKEHLQIKQQIPDAWIIEF